MPWIDDRVGIRTRHTVLPLDYIKTTRNATPGALEAALVLQRRDRRQAARMALQTAGLTPATSGWWWPAAARPTSASPREACRVAEELGIDCPRSTSLGAAPASRPAHFLDGMRPDRLPDYVLVVNPENSTRVVDYRDRRPACSGVMRLAPPWSPPTFQAHGRSARRCFGAVPAAPTRSASRAWDTSPSQAQRSRSFAIDVLRDIRRAPSAILGLHPEKPPTRWR